MKSVHSKTITVPVNLTFEPFGLFLKYVPSNGFYAVSYLSQTCYKIFPLDCTLSQGTKGEQITRSRSLLLLSFMYILKYQNDFVIVMCIVESFKELVIK